MAIKRNNGGLRKLQGERWVILSSRDVSAPLSMFWMIWSLAYCLTVGRVDVCVMHMLWGSRYAPPAPTNAFSPQKKEITHCQEKQQMLIILMNYWEAHVDAVFRNKVFFFFSTKPTPNPFENIVFVIPLTLSCRNDTLHFEGICSVVNGPPEAPEGLPTGELYCSEVALLCLRRLNWVFCNVLLK